MTERPSPPARRGFLAASAAAGAVALASPHLAAANSGSAIRPFRVSVPDEELADLRRRVLATRWPDRETVTDQSQGVQRAAIQGLAPLGDRLRLVQDRGEAERTAAPRLRGGRQAVDLRSRAATVRRQPPSVRRAGCRQSQVDGSMTGKVVGHLRHWMTLKVVRRADGGIGMRRPVPSNTGA